MPEDPDVLPHQRTFDDAAEEAKATADAAAREAYVADVEANRNDEHAYIPGERPLPTIPESMKISREILGDREVGDVGGETESDNPNRHEAA